MNRPFRLFSAAALWLVCTNACFASEVLFYKVPRNYGQEGLLGEAFRREFETRMFTHPNWRQRLYGESHDPDVNETLETYTKPDRSIWLSHRHAVPSLSRIIWSRIYIGERFNLTKRLDSVHITDHEIALAPDVAKELELLWRAMLPGLEEAPKPPVLYMHTPRLIAFSRENNSVETGSIAIAAYNTPIYRGFLGVVGDLKDLCDHGADSTDPAFGRLADRIRRLRARLQ
jgi:hypothetical protein